MKKQPQPREEAFVKKEEIHLSEAEVPNLKETNLSFTNKGLTKERQVAQC